LDGPKVPCRPGWTVWAANCLWAEGTRRLGWSIDTHWLLDTHWFRDSVWLSDSHWLLCIEWLLHTVWGHGGHWLLNTIGRHDGLWLLHESDTGSEEADATGTGLRLHEAEGCEAR